MTTNGVNIYDLTIPGAIRSLEALNAILSKAAAQAASENTPLETFLAARLAPDMKPFPYQIQQACNTAKSLPARVGGLADRTFADDETTWADLQARIGDTVGLLRGVERAAFEGKEAAEVEYRGHAFTGLSYVTDFFLPNFYFHVTTAYALLRANGVQIGKLDYLGIVRRQPAA